MKPIVCLLLAFFISCQAVCLEEKQPSLTLEEAWNLVIENHEQVKSLYLNNYQAKLNIRQTLARIFPCVGASASVIFSNPSEAVDGERLIPSNFRAGSIKVNQPLIDLRFRPSYLSAKLAKDATCHQTEFELFELLYMSSEAFLAVLQSKDLLHVSEHQLALAEQQYEVTKEQYENGKVTITDLLRSEEQVNRSKRALQDVRSDALIYEENLSNLVGIDICYYQLILPESIDLFAEKNLPCLLEEAFKRRQDLKGVAASIEAMKLQIRALKRNNWPRLDLLGEYTLASPETLSYRNNSWSAALILSAPLFDGWQNCLCVKNAEAELSKQELLYSRLLKDLRVQVKSVYLALTSAEANFALLKNELSIAEENYQIFSERYKKGQTTNIDLLDALNTYIQAQANYAIAKYDLILLTIKLKKETGFFDELLSCA